MRIDDVARTDHEVIDTMLLLGGNFVQHLARAFCAADAVNQQRLKLAFADEWQRYAELAARRPPPQPEGALTTLLTIEKIAATRTRRRKPRAG
jgi:hypothetical protein